MRVLIADDHDLLRDALVLYLESEGGIETETAPDLPSAVARIEAGAVFDLVLLDVMMPGMNGLDSLQEVMALRGGQRVALISGTGSPEMAERALGLGAAGYLPKTLPAKSLINAVRFMAMGEQYAPLDFLRTAQAEATNPLASRLSRRELEALKGLVAGKSNKEIARDLGVTEPTVKLHVKTLYRKIDAHNRTQAAMIAREAGLF
ncbi:response regulator transcription factor [Frigidibacter sp. MR17.14]|uniref:response regulator transcription factor n=1 Tax=Frigidibacter sp. MR17.14 TaxID=3126509 RepID=UPI003012DBF9